MKLNTRRFLGMFLVSSSLASGFLSAQAAKPFLTKSSGAGFIHPDYSRSESCEMFLDRVVISKYYGAFQTKEVRMLNMGKGPAMLIERALKEPVQSQPNGLCDGPTTSVTLIPQISLSPTPTQVPVYFTGGCGTPTLKREGPASSALMDLIGTYCTVNN